MKRPDLEGADGEKAPVGSGASAKRPWRRTIIRILLIAVFLEVAVMVYDVAQGLLEFGIGSG